MFHGVKDRIQRMRFDAQCQTIRSTPPVRLQPRSNAALLTQLQHKDVSMYLLAIKSFTRFLDIGAAFVVDDGSLTEADHALLSIHVPGVVFIALSENRSGACPQGGTWERLLSIAELTKRYYVIQLDSDTLTLAAIPEVTQCVAEGRSFTIGTWDNQRTETMAERVAHARTLPHGDGAHVQIVAEAHFNCLRDFEKLKYVRGCSGFAGFAPSAFTREFVEGVSRQMMAAIGPRWAEWGSEQVMSNIVVANAPSAVVLPHPKYADCKKMQRGRTVFIHFIGDCRFVHGTYIALGREVIRALVIG